MTQHAEDLGVGRLGENADVAGWDVELHRQELGALEGRQDRCFGQESGEIQHVFEDMALGILVEHPAVELYRRVEEFPLADPREGGFEGIQVCGADGRGPGQVG